MRITGLEARIVDAGMRNWIFVRVETDQAGLYGWGEATLEWKTRGVVGTIEDLRPLALGLDPRDIEQLYQRLTKHGFWRLGAIGLSAISGIEQACWDIKGKAMGVPVWQLLGGQVRDRIRLYTHLGLGDSDFVYGKIDIPRLTEAADRIRAAGYTAFKALLVPPTHYARDETAIRESGEVMSALRDHVGEAVDIMVDFHGRPAGIAAARAYVDALAPGRPYFLEEILPPGHEDEMAEIARACAVPIATGERLFSRQDFLPVFTRRAVHIVQPDLSHCGGLWEARKIAAMAEAFGMGVAPHNPNGPIAGAAALHFAIATPNVMIQESMIGAVPWYHEVVQGAPEAVAGHWHLPTRPGLGVEIDERAALRHPMGPEPNYAMGALARDGTVLDW